MVSSFQQTWGLGMLASLEKQRLCAASSQGPHLRWAGHKTLGLPWVFQGPVLWPHFQESQRSLESGERDLPGEGKASDQEPRVCQTAGRGDKQTNKQTQPSDFLKWRARPIVLSESHFILFTLFFVHTLEEHAAKRADLGFSPSNRGRRRKPIWLGWPASVRLLSFLLPFGLLPCLLGVTDVLTDVGEKECPVPFKVLLGRLRVKLTPDRLTGEKQFLILYPPGVHTDVEIPETDQMRHGCHPETRRRGWSLGRQREGMQLHRKMRKHKCLINTHLLGPSETTGHRGFDQMGLARFLPIYYT